MIMMDVVICNVLMMKMMDFITMIMIVLNYLNRVNGDDDGRDNIYDNHYDSSDDYIAYVDTYCMIC
jgi:hypothetical protein